MIIERETGLTTTKLRERIAENHAQLIEANRRGMKLWAASFECRALALANLLERKRKEVKRD